MGPAFPEEVFPEEKGRNSQAETNRKLENLVGIEVEIYEQLAVLATLQARESDLRTGNMRATYLASDNEPTSFLGEVLFSAFLTIVLTTSGKLLPQSVREGARDLIDSWTGWTLDPVEATLFLLAVPCVLALFLWVYTKSMLGREKRAMRGQLLHAVQRGSDLYLQHSTLGGRLLRARQRHVQISARMHQFSGLGWGEIAMRGGTRDMRAHVDQIAEIDRQSRQDAQEYEHSGGDYWLDMLRSSLRGDLPYFICFYVAEVRQNRGDRSGRTRAAAHWRTQALQLCTAERRVLARDFPLKQRAYRELDARLRKARSFSLGVLDDMLAIWKKHNSDPGLRDGEARQRFEDAFRSWIVGGEPSGGGE